MDLELDGMVAAVAAGSRGIGRATALKFSQEGASVSICARGQEDLQRTVNDCPGPALGVEADVREDQDVSTFLQDTVEAFGGIDILVNNAGGPPPGRLEDCSLEEVREGLELNLLSMIRLSQRALPQLRSSDQGRIVNITSVTAKQPLPDLALSNIARTGVLAAAKTLSRELAAAGITVNSVLPGTTDTERLRSVVDREAEQEGVDPEVGRERSREQVPLGRWAQPEEIADAVVFLASARASYITGTALQVDGGFIEGYF